MDKIRYKDYIAQISYSVEDEYFFVKILNSETIMSFYVDTYLEIFDTFIDLIEDYILLRKELGKEIEIPKMTEQDLKEKNYGTKALEDKEVYFQSFPIIENENITSEKVA